MTNTSLANENKVHEGRTTTIYVEGTPVEPTEEDLLAIATTSGVSVESIQPQYVECWDYRHQTDVTQYWVSLKIHWCWDSTQVTGHSIWEYPDFDVKNYLTVYQSSGSWSGPLAQGVDIAEAFGSWHFQSPGPGGSSINYYPSIHIIANNRGSVEVTEHT